MQSFPFLLIYIYQKLEEMKFEIIYLDLQCLKPKTFERDVPILKDIISVAAQCNL